MKPTAKPKSGSPAKGAAVEDAPEPGSVVFLEAEDWREKELKEPGSAKDYGLRITSPTGRAKQMDPADPYTLDYVITTEEQDRHGDVIDVGGWSWDDYMRGGPGPVLFGHDRSSLPVAQCPSIKTIGTGQVGRAKFPTAAEAGYADDEPFFANTVRCLSAAGYLKSTSVGFLPSEYTWDNDLGGFHFYAQEGLEWSIVPVPANPGCFQLAAQKGIALGPLEDWAVRALDEIHGRKGLYVTRSKLEMVLRACGLRGDVKFFDLTEVAARAALKSVGAASSVRRAKATSWGEGVEVDQSAEAADRDTAPGAVRGLAAELADAGVSLEKLLELAGKGKDVVAPIAEPAPTAEGSTAGDEVILELAEEPGDDDSVELDVDGEETLRSLMSGALKSSIADALNEKTASTGKVY